MAGLLSRDERNARSIVRAHGGIFVIEVYGRWQRLPFYFVGANPSLHSDP
jgi:hypothetical protein